MAEDTRMDRLANWSLTAAVLVVAFVAGIAGGMVTHHLRLEATASAAAAAPAAGAHVAGPARAGAPLPDAQVALLAGGSTSVRSYIGHPLWINFFATWCPPCNAELPEIERHYQRDAAEGLTVVGLDQQESAAKVQAFAQARGLTYQIGIDDGGAANAYGVTALPTSIFVDAQGVVRSVAYGALSAREMDAALAAIGVR